MQKQVEAAASRQVLDWSEVPNQEHWWWDTAAPNDGGVMYDPVVRHFVQTR